MEHSWNWQLNLEVDLLGKGRVLFFIRLQVRYPCQKSKMKQWSQHTLTDCQGLIKLKSAFFFEKMTGYITIAANKLYLSKDILFLTTWCQWKDSRPCWSSLKADFRQETRRYCKSLSWRRNKLSGFWCVACRTVSVLLSSSFPRLQLLQIFLATHHLGDIPGTTNLPAKDMERT